MNKLGQNSFNVVLFYFPRMALKGLERQRIRREKLKQEKYELYKQHHNKVSKKSRAKKKEHEKTLSAAKQNKLLLKRRNDTRNRVNKCRALKKERLTAVMQARRSDESPPFNPGHSILLVHLERQQQRQREDCWLTVLVLQREDLLFVAKLCSQNSKKKQLKH